jgi:hypothetical protein
MNAIALAVRSALKRFFLRLQRPLLLVICLCCLQPLAAGADKSSQNFVDPTAGSKYLGVDSCKSCHAEIYEKNFRTYRSQVLPREQYDIVIALRLLRSET